MPVGIFSPLAKIEIVKPGGRVMSPPFPGSKRAVSALQSGFATTPAAVAVRGSIRKVVAANVSVKVVNGLRFISAPLFGLVFKTLRMSKARPSSRIAGTRPKVLTNHSLRAGLVHRLHDLDLGHFHL